MKSKYEANWYNQLLHGECEYRLAAYSTYRKNPEDRAAYILCDIFIMFLVLSYTAHCRIQMGWVRKHVIQNIIKIGWLFEQIENK